MAILKTSHLQESPTEVCSAVCEHMRKSVPQGIFKWYQNLQVEMDLLTFISEDYGCIISWTTLNSGQVYFTVS